MYSAEAGCFQKSEFHLGMAKIQVELVTCLDKKKAVIFFSMSYCCRVVFFKGLLLLRVNRNKVNILIFIILTLKFYSYFGNSTLY